MPVPGLPTVVGEAVDILWAPASSYLIGALFKDTQFASLGLLEELLPGTDIIPTATLVCGVCYAIGLASSVWCTGQGTFIECTPRLVSSEWRTDVMDHFSVQ